MKVFMTRRKFIKLIGLLSLGMFSLSLLENFFLRNKGVIASDKINDNPFPQKATEDTMGSISHIYEARNGTPEQNVKKVVEMMGGIERIVGKNDIVILKPNAQWWNQGVTNTNAMKGFIELILHIPKFEGEIIIAENYHCYESMENQKIRGWATNMRNGDFNLNELIVFFQEQGYKNVTKYEWVDAGVFSIDKSVRDKLVRPLKNIAKKVMGIKRGKIVVSPEEGDGYVWTDIEYKYSGKKTRMSYPIFSSSYSGTRIDFKNGAWRYGHFTGQPFKFINFAVLNHHGSFAGVTSSVKNYLGIVDMTCGFPGVEPEGYVNFHHMGIPGMGGAVGTFMNTIRRADLNIVTAEWVGFGSRTDKKLSAKPRTILASYDPVALDYYGAKYVLLPLGGKVELLNNPDNRNGPFRRYLDLCCAQGIGVLEENKMGIHKFSFNS